MEHFYHGWMHFYELQTDGSIRDHFHFNSLNESNHTYSCFYSHRSS